MPRRKCGNPHRSITRAEQPWDKGALPGPSKGAILPAISSPSAGPTTASSSEPSARPLDVIGLRSTRHPNAASHVACRALEIALVTDDPVRWCEAAAVFEGRLACAEIMRIAVAALVALAEEDAAWADHVAHPRAGMPFPPFADPIADARLWAAAAARSELKAYFWAAWRQLAPRDRTAFLVCVGRGKDAA